MPTRGFLEGIVKGGNSFTRVLGAEVLREMGLIAATRPDLEKMFGRNFRLFLNYVDVGVALRTNGDSYAKNDSLAKTLYGDLNQSGIDVESGGGKLVSFNALSLDRSTSSPYGVVFRFNGKAAQDDILDLSSFKWDCSRNDGLSQAGFAWDLGSAGIPASRVWLFRWRWSGGGCPCRSTDEKNKEIKSFFFLIFSNVC